MHESYEVLARCMADAAASESKNGTGRIRESEWHVVRLVVWLDFGLRLHLRFRPHLYIHLQLVVGLGLGLGFSFLLILGLGHL